MDFYFEFLDCFYVAFFVLFYLMVFSSVFFCAILPSPGAYLWYLHAQTKHRVPLDTQSVSGTN